MGERSPLFQNNQKSFRAGGNNEAAMVSVQALGWLQSKQL